MEAEEDGAADARKQGSSFRFLKTDADAAEARPEADSSSTISDLMASEVSSMLDESKPYRLWETGSDSGSGQSCRAKSRYDPSMRSPQYANEIAI